VKRTLAVAGLMLATAGVVISTPASADVHLSPACSLDQLVHDRVAQLGTDTPWSIGVTPADRLGDARRSGVVVSRETPCDRVLVTSIVNHEWVHTQQFKKYSKNHIPRGYDLEGVADCGSRLLGSVVTPYIGDAPCTDAQLTEARDLIKLTDAHLM
jgi:hypothetical protein